MCTKQMLWKFSQCVVTGAAFASVLFLLSCSLGRKPAPERPFTTIELLIGLEDMPAGWESFPPYKPVDYLCVNDCATIDFEADTDLPRRRAYEDIFRYKSAVTARKVYKELLLPVGNMPPEWSYRSSAADEFTFVCYDYEGREPPICEWTARYDEYIVIFRSWLIPGRMSLTNMEQVIRAIDTRMARYLNKLSEVPVGRQ
jgi:hypothetical protein